MVLPRSVQNIRCIKNIPSLGNQFSFRKMSASAYTFQSQRLGLRNWRETDLASMAAINADPRVMEFFPSTQTETQTLDFIRRMQVEFAEKGFCYFAVDRLDTGEMIGFIGLHVQTFEAAFTPCIDIGWRLNPNAWGQGFATEGARACLHYAFSQLKLEKIVALAPLVNKRSIHVMEKLGMRKMGTFSHPVLKANPDLEECALYEIENPLG
jgi:RimJ/RimL family protein N-acetyltransferase